MNLLLSSIARLAAGSEEQHEGHRGGAVACGQDSRPARGAGALAGFGRLARRFHIPFRPSVFFCMFRSAIWFVFPSRPLFVSRDVSSDVRASFLTESGRVACLIWA